MTQKGQFPYHRSCRGLCCRLALSEAERNRLTEEDDLTTLRKTHLLFVSVRTECCISSVCPELVLANGLVLHEKEDN